MSNNDNQGSEKLKENHDKPLLTVKEVANHIDESPHVIRNWLKEFKNYIPTEKGDNNYHYFNQEGIDKLLLIKKLSREQGYSIKQIEFYFATGEDPFKKKEVAPDFEDKIMKELGEVKTSLKRQEEFNLALLNKLQGQQKYIDNSIKERDTNLLEQMKNLQQARLEASASKEKRGFFSKLFRKNSV